LYLTTVFADCCFPSRGVHTLFELHNNLLIYGAKGMKRFGLSRFLYVASVMGLMLVLGCGGVKTAQVHGKVVYNNKPVTGGKLTFYLADDTKVNPSSGFINEDGTFSIDKVPVGKVKVAVDTRGLKEGGGGRTMPGTPNKENQLIPPGGISDEMKQKMEAQGKTFGPQTMKMAGTFVAIPDKYTDPEKSGLSFDIKSSDNEITIELK
jgi:hypothetical protein